METEGLEYIIFMYLKVDMEHDGYDVLEIITDVKCSVLFKV